MLAPGTSVGRYVVQRKLAEGGMAEIYLASAVGAEGFAKDVVIKVVRSFLATDQQFVQMFIAEARLASKLNHANVVQIFDFGKHDETYYLAMEYVRGASLWDLRKRCREFGVPFPPTLAAEMGAQVARGLQYAHGLSEGGQRIGVVHRDVTPHNVLLSFDGAVKLTDFGIAKATTTQTAPGMLKGKFAYMSPEQGRGDRVDARTDVFALGIVLWELLTGGRLFDGDSDVAVLRAVQDSFIAPPSRLNPDVAPDLSDIVMKALSRTLEERFQSAFELEKALATWVLRNATAFEDTSVSSFVQQMFREEFEAQPAPTLPALGPGDDFGTGNTMYVDRAKRAQPVLPTMTNTPVQRIPDRATPRPVRGLDEAPIPVPRSTEPERVVGPSAPAPQPARPATTEQRPAFKPGPASRRFDPLPVSEPSLVKPVLLTDAVDGEPTESASKSSRVEALSEEVALPPRAKTPLVLLAVAALGIVGGVAAMAWSSPESATRPVVAATVEEDAGPTEKDAGMPTPDAGTSAADAGAAPDAGPTTPDAGSALSVGPVAQDAGPPAVVRQGSLTVKAIPFAEVYANGRMLGEVTGSRTFKLRAGVWKIELRRNKVSRTLTVTVRPNQDTVIELEQQQQ